MEAKKKTDMVAANALFLLHCALVCFLLSGWLFPRLSVFYVIALAATLSSWLFFGYCLLSKWEFDLRKKYDSRFEYGDRYLNDGYIAHYGRTFFNIRLPTQLLERCGVVFLVVMLAMTLVHGLSPFGAPHALAGFFK